MVHVIHVPTPLELPCALRDSFGGLASRRPSLGPMAAANQGSIAVALSWRWTQRCALLVLKAVSCRFTGG